MEINLDNINRVFDSFDDLHICILGDIMLDRFIRGSVDRISPEAPVPVMLREKEECFPGGAANVSMNIVELGGKAHQFGVIGTDAAGEVVKDILAKVGIDTNSIIQTSAVPTTVKTRFVSMGQQLLRVDEETHLSDRQAGLDKVLQLPDLCDALLVSDYNKGAIPVFAESLLGQARERGIPTVIDPKPPNWNFYHGCTVVTPNKKECLSTLPENNVNEQQPIEEIARSVQNKADAKNVVLTWGAEGLYTWNGEALEFVKSHRVPVFDSTGAGDSVIAALTLALAGGLDLTTAAHIANAAGAVAVSRPGIARVSRRDILKILSAKEEL